VKKVVEDHGGEIRYDDTSTGAAFEIVLPMALVRDDRVAEVAEVNV
jgi:nitrogen fixation/metabolism regulation signal transduction histidine kinase